MAPEGDWNSRAYNSESNMNELMKEIPPTSTSITDMFYKQNGEYGNRIPIVS